MSTPVAAPSRRAKLTPPTAPVAPASEIKLTEDQKKAKNAARMRQIRKGFDTAVATQQAQAFVLYGTALPEFNGAPAAPVAAPAKAPKAAKPAPVAAAPVVTAVAKPARAKKVAVPAPVVPAKAVKAPKAVVPAPVAAPAAPARAAKVAAVAKASADTRFVVTDLSTLKLYHASSAAELTKILAGL